MTQSSWAPDVLGDSYEQTTIPLGTDPDGQGSIEATLVRYDHPGEPAADPATTAVLYIHGYTDYFFHRHVAEFFGDRGYRFYALDLRKCGRSLKAGQTPHYVTDLALYDQELNAALDIVTEATGGGSVLVVAHSTGGLIVSLWLDRVRPKAVAGAVLNSPWFDLQGPAYVRTVAVKGAIEALGRFRALTALPRGEIDAYGASIHASAKGEWDYNVDWKPLTGFPIRLGWLRAIRRGHAQLQRGLDIGVPALVLRSKLTKFVRAYGPEIDVADAVLDVKQIQRWSGCLGDRTTVAPIEGARHDVFLSAPEVRAKAFEELDLWLDWLRAHLTKG